MIHGRYFPGIHVTRYQNMTSCSVVHYPDILLREEYMRGVLTIHLYEGCTKTYVVHILLQRYVHH